MHGWGRWVAMVKQPTTLPRWALFISNGALIATVLVGAISFGRSAGRTEDALRNAREVPALQENVKTVTSQLTEIKELIKQQGDANVKTQADQNRKIDAIQQGYMTELTRLGDKVNTIQGQMGSVWALAQSDSNKISELKGMVNAMQLQQQKDK